MRTASNRRRWWPVRPAVVTVVFLVAVVALLSWLGMLDLSRLGLGVSLAGLMPVPVSAVAIPAYTQVTRDHLWDAKARSIAVVRMRPEQVTGDIMTNLRDVLGRVLDHDKPAGFVFTEADFFPRGTRPGLVAGIPAGKRAVRVDAEKVQGLYGLRPGDRFDLVATLPIDANRMQTLGIGGPFSKQLELQARMTNWQKQATVHVIVQNGSIVQPMTTRQIPVFARTLTQGPVTRTRPVQEIVIAVDPSEVAGLTEALSVDAEISCVPRSGRPDDPLNSRTPDSQPWSPFGGVPGAISNRNALASVPPLTTVEAISGTNRQVVTTPLQTGRP